jgi:transposase
MEATGIYWEAVAEYPVDAGFTVIVVNPAQIKAYGAASMVRTNTDKVDARLIADFCLAQSPASWQAPPPALRELRALVARRDTLDTMRTQEQNRLLVARELVKAGIEVHLEQLEKAIADVEKAIHQKIDDDTDLAFFTTAKTSMPNTTAPEPPAPGRRTPTARKPTTR